jgi:hypothetical protein
MITDIDTNKYEGHTEGEWILNRSEANPTEFLLKCGDTTITWLEPSEADAQLIADAPLLLAEVIRLRERLIRAYDWAENAVNGNDSAMMDYTEYVCGGEEE